MDFTQTTKVTHTGKVVETYALRSDLPKQLSYRVFVVRDGDFVRITSQSDPGSNGGVRHYVWGQGEKDFDETAALWKAFDHGIKWANKKRHSDKVSFAAYHVASENGGKSWLNMRMKIFELHPELSDAALDAGATLAYHFDKDFRRMRAALSN